jgi:putative addiction module component (TIGR02574 family)
MAVERVMIDIDSLSREQKLDLMERIWDRLVETHQEIPLWDWQRDELVRRLGTFEKDGDLGEPADEVLNRLHGRDE